ncbi:MAG: PhzF family phenazine biosynthesis protein [Gammaproteobacteria bacterium]
MKLPLWQVDAFASKVFAGNPAAVVPLGEWLPDSMLLSIAAENNLAETAFIVPHGDGYAIRWFTPTVEMPLCGHATLASGWVVLNRLEPERAAVTFQSKSGPLTVRRDGALLSMDFPSIPPGPATPNPDLVAALGAGPKALYEGFQWFAVYESAEQVRALRPDLATLGKLPLHGVIVTARGSDCDFVSRFFAPAAGVPEDPVTGSAHCRLVPYWARELGKRKLHARQVSARGGELWCELDGDRVRMAGHAALYLEGTIEV